MERQGEGSSENWERRGRVREERERERGGGKNRRSGARRERDGRIEWVTGVEKGD